MAPRSIDFSLMNRALPDLVSVAWLDAEQRSQSPIRVVDTRWRLGDREFGCRAYDAGHVAGAVFLDVDADLAAAPGRGDGRHPLPTPDAFAATMARIGVGDDTLVVAYDDAGGATAARLWFLLRYFGHETGAVLDGGIAAWQAAGLRLELDRPKVTVPAAPFVPRVRPELVVSAGEVERLRGQEGELLLDARASERFRGDSEPIDPKAGHIPGAKSAPFAGNLASGAFRPHADLRSRYADLGADRARSITCYCGSGITACHDLLALALAGFREARLYAGSWSDWSGRPGSAVATGDS
jgi:thiosulfate/3-mercaptopyruvate sulfurtransferase